MSTPDLTGTMKRTAAVLLATGIGVALLAGFGPAANAAIGPKVVNATKTKGVRTIGSLTVGPVASVGQMTLADVKAAVGAPKSVDRNCAADYGSGLTLVFANFGGGSDCDRFFLQGAEIRGSAWRVKVGAKTYRTGMSKRRIPARAKHFPYFGYQLASMPFIGRRTGSVYAQVGSKNKISKIHLFIGGAGD